MPGDLDAIRRLVGEVTAEQLRYVDSPSAYRRDLQNERISKTNRQESKA